MNLAAGRRSDRQAAVPARAPLVPRAASRPAPRRSGDEANAAWAAVGRLIAGPLLYGGLGYLLDRWLGTAPAFLCVGVIGGFVAAIYLVIATSGPAGASRAPASRPARGATPSVTDPQENDRGA